MPVGDSAVDVVAPRVEALQPRPNTPAMPQRAAYRAAAVFVLPYFLLMLAWAFSNPPGSAPDEGYHLIKALGVARGHIGRPASLANLPPGLAPIFKRNLSLTRIVPIPARLNPTGYGCTKGTVTLPATCLPKHAPTGTGTVDLPTAMGAYPPFLYPPIGLVAELTDTPYRAYLAGRAVCLLMGSVLLLTGAAVLVGWLGRRCLLGAFLGLTPMAIFASAMVSTSGVEICSAFALACVCVVAIRRPAALGSRSVMWTLGGVGCALILSRQLGSVTFAGLVLVMLIRVGREAVPPLLRRREVPFVSSVVLLIASIAAVAWWERTYDHPTDIGGVFADGAYSFFVRHMFFYVQGGVGLFGWLDAPVPKWVVLAWVLLIVCVVGMAILMGSKADRWTIIGWLVALGLITYVTCATVFYPINANVQARHLLPFFQFAPLLAGVVVVESLEAADPAALRRVVRLIALVMPVIQFVGLYANARRYAVGLDGPLWFVGHSKWSPRFGWSPWLALGLVGAVVLVRVVLTSNTPHRRAPAYVER